MASFCSRCGKQLSFRDSFVWEKKPICGACLKEVEHGQSLKELPETSAPDLSDEGMTGGEWLGAFFCTPYGLIKYFDWKKTSPRKAKQVCTFYLIAYPIAIIIRILIETAH